MIKAMHRIAVVVAVVVAGAAGATLSPSAAHAQDPNAYLLTNVNLRAGPGTEYPVIITVPNRAQIAILGCLEDYNWCDIAFEDQRGWMRSIYLSYWYNEYYYPLRDYAPQLDLQIVSFDVDAYWGEYYQDRPFYAERTRWEQPVDQGYVDEAVFYDRLAPDGEWVWIEGRYVWVPRGVDREWRPYTDGRWAYTNEYGWTWQSNERFGWATYHYGRWGFSKSVGWFWVPGRKWAPAWVSWRQSDDYLAWAPLPPSYYDDGPDIAININIGGGRDVPDYYWQMVRNDRFLDDDLRYNIVRDRNVFARDFRNTRPLGDVTIVNNKTVVNKVVNVNYIEQKTNKKVVIHKVEKTREPKVAKAGKAKDRAEVVEVFEPPAEEKPRNRAPRKPKKLEEVAALSETKEQSGNEPATEEMLVPPEVIKDSPKAETPPPPLDEQKERKSKRAEKKPAPPPPPAEGEKPGKAPVPKEGVALPGKEEKPPVTGEVEPSKELEPGKRDKSKLPPDDGMPEGKPEGKAARKKELAPPPPPEGKELPPPPLDDAGPKEKPEGKAARKKELAPPPPLEGKELPPPPLDDAGAKAKPEGKAARKKELAPPPPTGGDEPPPPPSARDVAPQPLDDAGPLAKPKGKAAKKKELAPPPRTGGDEPPPPPSARDIAPPDLGAAKGKGGSKAARKAKSKDVDGPPTMDLPSTEKKGPPPPPSGEGAGDLPPPPLAGKDKSGGKGPKAPKSLASPDKPKAGKAKKDADKGASLKAPAPKPPSQRSAKVKPKSAKSKASKAKKDADKGASLKAPAPKPPSQKSAKVKREAPKAASKKAAKPKAAKAKQSAPKSAAKTASRKLGSAKAVKKPSAGGSKSTAKAKTKTAAKEKKKQQND
jgi:uncharacterized protein YraI